MSRIVMVSSDEDYEKNYFFHKKNDNGKMWATDITNAATFDSPFEALDTFANRFHRKHGVVPDLTGRAFYELNLKTEYTLGQRLRLA